MSSPLEGKRTLVTGASRGIGRGIAVAFARAGADVALGYRRDQSAADEVIAEIEGLGRKAVALAADVRDLDAMRALVQGSVDALGGLDVVVANAGVASRFQPLHEVDPGYWQRVIDVDLGGVFNTLHAALPVLREQRSGVILSISSVAADACGANGAPYNAAKAGVNALTQTVARENAILKSIPLGRAGTPQDIGELAVYLASEAGAWISGQVFRIDGGALGASARRVV
ncbi:MAG: SDR family oxidoreductase [Deltaproteobacteria bacterium]|nr:SDR family oxidoreductase [Deltaproteobacteria bacterium]